MDEHFDKLVEQIDACRPGSADLKSIEMASLARHLADDPQAQELYDRIQAFDTKLVSVFSDVTPPAGLEQRLLAGVSDEVDQKPSPVTTNGSKVIASRRFSRRWLVTVSALALSLCVGFGIWTLLNGKQQELTAENVRALARTFYEQDRSDGAAPLDDRKLLRRHPISDRVRRGMNPGWRQVQGFLGHPAVAYDLTSRRSSLATLYVSVNKISQLPTDPVEEWDETGGRWITAWQEGDLLYVLVVEQNEGENHLEFLNPLPPTV